jgi:hypothetical protein
MVAIVGTAALALGATPAQALSKKEWDDASRLGEVGLVAAGLSLPAAKGDGKGALQSGESVAAAFVLTEGLKEIFPEQRPDRSNRRSFPSAHTSVSFAAAASMHQRYGWQVGLPATLVASFVGVARVEADKHHWYDVVVGAGIGEAAGFLLTSRRDASVRVLPWGDTHGAGLAMDARF